MASPFDTLRTQMHHPVSPRMCGCGWEVAASTPEHLVIYCLDVHLYGPDEAERRHEARVAALEAIAGSTPDSLTVAERVLLGAIRRAADADSDSRGGAS